MSILNSLLNLIILGNIKICSLNIFKKKFAISSKRLYNSISYFFRGVYFYMENNTIRIEGTVEEVLFQNTTNGFVVLDLSTENDLITVVGELGEIKDGEKLIVDGTYSTHSKFGTQFKATYCERKLPDTSESIEKYLASGIIKGIGVSTAKRIVNIFGDNTFNIIENEPERLLEIKGITKNKALKISKEFRHIFNLKMVVQYLMKFGLSSSVAMKSFRKWDFQTLEKIKDNPYILCSEGINVPFNSVEPIAQDCGIEHNSYKRILAGFEYVLMLANLDGHTCLPLNIFTRLSCSRLSINNEDFQKSLLKAIDNNSIYIYTDTFGKDYVYSKQYYNAETYIAKKISNMITSHVSKNTDYTQLIEYIEEHSNIIYGKEQKRAINMALNSPFMILTGGPGTGKTTTLKAMITIFETQRLKIKITAPTGRAAKRISEVTGYDTLTIHRLLEVTFDSDGNQTFAHNEDNPLNCNVLIVDETSMVDSLLMENLLRAVRNSCKIILVGDSNQLPSVSAGNILKDLISSNQLDVVVLDEIFRQAQESAIIMNAHKILGGNYPNVLQKDSDFFFLQRLTPISAQDTIIELWKDRLPKAYKYNPIEDIQILTSSKKGNLGTVNLNKLMQEAINPHVKGKKEFKNLNYTFRVGDKVMQIKNNYNVIWQKDGYSGSGIFNGDIGIIEDISSNTITINFDGRIVIYESELVDQLELAYSITIHKSQGSEFDVVIMPMLNNFNMLSYRNLLYTGVTRAKKLLVIVGSVKELYRMVDNNRQILRHTCLKDMITNEISKDE